MPQTQEPLVQALATMPQVLHVPPSRPQSVKAVPDMHELPMPDTLGLQQPGQRAALQTQMPPMHCSPALHIALPPHLQAPELQLSARVMSQAVQAAPLVPQAPSVGGVMQLPLLQQPFGQVELLHAPHAPLAQGRAPQFWQVDPPAPQVICDEVTHWFDALQQPVQPLVALQTQAF